MQLSLQKKIQKFPLLQGFRSNRSSYNYLYKINGSNAAAAAIGNIKPEPGFFSVVCSPVSPSPGATGAGAVVACCGSLNSCGCGFTIATETFPDPFSISAADCSLTTAPLTRAVVVTFPLDAAAAAAICFLFASALFLAIIAGASAVPVVNAVIVVIGASGASIIPAAIRSGFGIFFIAALTFAANA